MNIFRTSDSPNLAAIYLDDARVVKMFLETAQMLSTVLRKHEVDEDWLYKATHANHPCTLWAGYSRDNFSWLQQHGLCLANEYRHRFGRIHKSSNIIGRSMDYFYSVPFGEETPAPFCGPDDIKALEIPVTDKYMMLMRRKWDEDKRVPKWTNRGCPDWREETE